MSTDDTCLAMTRKMPGLHEGVNLRAEKSTRGGWSFEMRMRPLGAGTFWYEHTPDGQWVPIGSWKTLRAGRDAAELLRKGTHYWEGKDLVCRLYNEETYAVLRGENEDS